MLRSTKWCLGVGCGGAVLVLLGGLLGWIAFPAIVESTVADTVAVKKGTDAWDRWIELPLPMQFKVVIYDIQNPIEITEGQEPIYIERGPYVYTETRVKEEIDYRESEDKASYYQRLMFHFDAESSNGTENDYVTVPSIPLISFVQISNSIEPLASSLSQFDAAWETIWKHQVGQSIFTNVTVRDYLFEGIPMYCNLTEPLTLKDLPAIIVCAGYGLVAPRTVDIRDDDFSVFSFFNFKNDSRDGRYEVALGLDDVEKIGNILLWENSTRTEKWGDDSCNAIKGTDSTIFRPKLDDVEELWIYSTDICRSVKLTYKEETEFQGISGRRYVANEKVFAGPITENENYCFCPQSVNNLTSRGGCLKDGLLELSSCQGAPVILSLPHFLYSDKSYQDANPSLTANPEEHQIFLDLETYTGSPLRGASRIQMNIHLKQFDQVSMMKNFKGGVLPVLWLEEGVELNDKLLNMLHDELLDVLDILNIVRWVLIGVGIAVMAGATGFHVYRRFT